MACVHQQLGNDDKAEDENRRASVLQFEAEREIAEGTASGADLLTDVGYAPFELQRYWEGSIAASRGNYDGAFARYNRMVTEGMCYPEVLLRRGWLRLQNQDGSGLEDLRQAAEADPTWVTPHEAYMDVADADVPRHKAATYYRAVQRILAKTNLQEQLFIARLDSRPWRASTALLKAVGWAMRYSVLELVEPIYRCLPQGARPEDHPRLGR
jgi:hypothetical protein